MCNYYKTNNIILLYPIYVIIDWILLIIVLNFDPFYNISILSSYGYKGYWLYTMYSIPNK